MKRDISKWPATEFDGRKGLFDEDNERSERRKGKIDFCFTHIVSSDPCLHYEFHFGISWTRAAWFWQPFVTAQFGKHWFQLGWLY